MMTWNFRAHGAAKSKPVTVPAPCKYTSGDPLPASRTTVSMPLIFKWRRVNSVMVGPLAGVLPRRGGKSKHYVFGSSDATQKTRRRIVARAAVARKLAARRSRCPKARARGGRGSGLASPRVTELKHWESAARRFRTLAELPWAMWLDSAAAD